MRIAGLALCAWFPRPQPGFVVVTAVDPDVAMKVGVSKKLVTVPSVRRPLRVWHGSALRRGDTGSRIGYAHWVAVARYCE